MVSNIRYLLMYIHFISSQKKTMNSIRKLKIHISYKKKAKKNIRHGPYLFSQNIISISSWRLAPFSYTFQYMYIIYYINYTTNIRDYFHGNHKYFRIISDIFSTLFNNCFSTTKNLFTTLFGDML